MTLEQGLVFALLGATLALFLWGRWRHDVVALAALLGGVLMGLVPFADAFLGFGHPAVITVAAVLIISRGLENAGIADVVARLIAPFSGRPTLQIAAQTTLVALLSGFMNNVGALALMLPVALQNAYREGYSPARALMPLAFGSLLGGLVTLIGTPPNLIIASFRERSVGESFGLFDFAPVGGAVAVAGVLFLVLAGWRLLPEDRRGSGDERPFDIDDYLSEVKVPEDSRCVGWTVNEVEALAEDDVVVVGLVRGERRRLVPAATTRVQAGDVLVLEGSADGLEAVVKEGEVELVGSEGHGRKGLSSDEVRLVEAVVSPRSRMIGRASASLRLRAMHGINLLAIARHGRRLRERLRRVTFQIGDVLLLQVPSEGFTDLLTDLGCLPLAERELSLGRQRHLLLAGGLFGIAITLVVLGILPVQIAFMAAALAMVLAGLVPIGEVYRSIDWPVIVLLGAMLPVGMALETTGGTILVAKGLLGATDGLPAWWVIILLMVATMFLSDLVNNNATAVLMAPVAVTIAERMGASPDPFLMATAIGASCAFLTPIGHQSNTLVMAPGGYKFGDYWRMGLPLEAIIVAVSVPMILRVWPL